MRNDASAIDGFECELSRLRVKSDALGKHDPMKGRIMTRDTVFTGYNVAWKTNRDIYLQDLSATIFLCRVPSHCVA